MPSFNFPDKPPAISGKMARARVMSFMAGLQNRMPSDRSDPSRSRDGSRERAHHSPSPRSTSFNVTPKTSPPHEPQQQQQLPPAGRPRASSRPMSMVGGYQAPMMPVASDTIPELAPIFTLLNAHSNKLYQEGYFLKLNDLDTHGRPYPDRLWTECFAQLVGTVLSLWDAAALDAAGENGEVAPTFINLGDASIKMIESLQTRSEDTQPLTNVLSISTAGKNRYLLHFSTFNALTQWTAGIRLAMYENASLQEAYTGSLIAGKGRGLNNIKAIMERTRFRTEEWTRVRFGAGTPWRRCWCVISPPDDKDINAQKKAMKRKSAYDRSVSNLKGDIKFYDTRKITKKTRPVATISEAYSAYAIYPQSKALIDQSTLIKIEGPITIHTDPEVTTEGFVFVMPEVRPAVSGFEMMLRFIFPIYDVFILYGRPTRLTPETRDVKSLMFAMPQDRRSGYLEIFDVMTLINTSGSQSWSEREWKKQLKQLTLQRLNRTQGSQSHSRRASRDSSRHGHRNSLPTRGAIRFQDKPMRSTPALVPQSSSEPQDASPPLPPPHADSAPPHQSPFGPPSTAGRSHRRSVSDATRASHNRQNESYNHASSRVSHEQSRPRMMIEDDEDGGVEGQPPLPPKHDVPLSPPRFPNAEHYDSEDSDRVYVDAYEHRHNQDADPRAFGPVIAPPAFSHEPGALPATRPNAAPELRRANSRMSSATLSQLAAAGNFPAQHETPPPVPVRGGRASEDLAYRGVNDMDGTTMLASAADSGPAHHGMPLAGSAGPPRGMSETSAASTHSASPPRSPRHPPGPDGSQNSLHAPLQHPLRSTSPLSQTTSAIELTKPRAPPQAAVSQENIWPPAGGQTTNQRPRTSESTASDRPDGRPGLTSQKSLVRKPLPSQSPVRADFPPRTSSVYYGQSPQLSPEGILSHPGQRRESDYADAASTGSVDYTSDHEDGAHPAPTTNRDRPRSGVLRTVGNVDSSKQEVVIGDAHYQPQTAKVYSGSSWNVDFGPTQIYDPTVPSRKPTAGDRSSKTAHRLSYGHSRQASTSSPDIPSTAKPTGSYSRSTSENREGKRRSQVWQPGHAMGSPSTDASGMTPEQFVQHRAAYAHPVPPYANRPKSGSPHSRSPAPGASRNSSGDWSATTGGAASAQSGARGRPLVGSPDINPHLSAREQEHVSRLTGSPLVNINHNATKDGAYGGLVGAIDAREREKRDVRNMHANMAVQQAVAAQQALSGRTSQQSYASGHRATPSMQQVPGHFPATPQYYDGGWQENHMQGAGAVGYAAQPYATQQQPQDEYFAQGTAYGSGSGFTRSEEVPYRGSYRPGQDYRT